MDEFITNLGENIRKSREAKNMSMRQLAKLSGISPTAIQKIENNNMVPSVVVMYKIARALNKKMSSFLGEDPESNGVIHLNGHHRKRIKGDNAHSIVEMISGSSGKWTMQAAVHTIDKGSKSGNEMLTHRGEELVICLEGAIKFIINDEEYKLINGDTLHFDSSLPHFWENINEGVSKMIMVTIPPFR